MQDPGFSSQLRKRKGGRKRRKGKEERWDRGREREKEQEEERENIQHHQENQNYFKSSSHTSENDSKTNDQCITLVRMCGKRNLAGGIVTTEVRTAVLQKAGN